MTMNINMKKLVWLSAFLLVIYFVAGKNIFSQPSNSGTLSGFDGISWGTAYEQAKDRFRSLSSTAETKDPMEIIADFPEKEIRVKRKNVIYKYVFYKKPKILLETKAEQNSENQNTGADSSSDGNNGQANNDQSGNSQDNNGQGNNDQTNNGQSNNNQQGSKEALARLFIVESSFPYVPAEDLSKKISEKYGPRNGGTLNEHTKRGYYLWSLNSGYIIQWIDPYKQKPFSKSIYYVSKEIIAEIKTDFPKFQYSQEIKTLMNILY